MKKFLAEAHASFGGLGNGLCHIVVGNQASDLDSMASSILLAYLRHSQNPTETFIPVMNIPREDFPLRTEAHWFITKELGLDVSKILFTSDADFKALLAKGIELEIHLTDHNKLSSTQTFLEPYITEIIDHHADENLYGKTLKHKVVEPVGSCCTLIAEEFLASSVDMDSDIAKMLIGVILIDTVNFNPKAGRTTDKDTSIAKALASLITDADFTQDALFKSLQSAKFNVSALSSADLLRKDYKEWYLDEYNNSKQGKFKLGIASVTQSFLKWEEKDPNLCKAFSEFWDLRQVDLLLIMTAFANADKVFSRELAIFAPTASTEIYDKINQFLAETELQLSEVPLTKQTSRNGNLIVYAQGNASASRKVLQPLLLQKFFVK